MENYWIKIIKIILNNEYVIQGLFTKSKWHKSLKAENRRNEERNEDRREEAALTSRHITHTINVMSSISSNITHI